MDLVRLKELIRIFEASALYEIEIEESGRRVRLRKPPPNFVGSPNAPASLSCQLENSTPVILPGPTALAEAPKAEAPGDAGLTTIDSPMVGVFYSAPAPGSPPFASPGDTVEMNQTVCIIEAMKLMNEVAAKFPAEIVNVLVENGEPVEYGQALFTVRQR